MQTPATLPRTQLPLDLLGNVPLTNHPPTGWSHATDIFARPITEIAPSPVVILDVSSALANALSFPPWVGDVFRLAGFSIFLIGVLAWLTGRHAARRQWGQHVTLSGMALIIFGFAFRTFIDLLKYVLT